MLSLWRCVSQIGFVFRVRLAIVDLDVYPTGRNYAFLGGKPDIAQVRRLGESAKSVEPLSTLIEEVHPRAGGICVSAARREIGRGSEERRGVNCLIEHIVLMANPILAARRIVFLCL